MKSEEKDCIFFSFIRVHCTCVEFAFSYLLCSVCIVNQFFFSNKTKNKSNFETHVVTHGGVGQLHKLCRDLSEKGPQWRKSLAPRYNLLTYTNLETWLISWEG